MPANDINPELNSEELRPPASVLRTLAFVRSRGARSSAPGPDGTMTPLGIGSLGLAAESLAQSLTMRALSPLVLGRPDWLTALLQRHRFASWSLGLPNLYYFHWLRAAEEEKKTGAAGPFSAPIQRPIIGRTPATGPALPLPAAATMAAASPSWAVNPPAAYPTPDFALARRRVAGTDEDSPSAPSRAVSPRFDVPQSVPLLPGTLNATSVLAPMLTLHTSTAQGRSAAWTDSSLMQSAHPEVMAEAVIRRAQTAARRSNDPAPERAADSPYMPVSYPPVPLASWLGVSASAPERVYWEAITGFARPQFSPASSHLLVLPKLVAEVRTRPDFESPSETAFASLQRLGSARTSAQITGAASASVQAAQSAVVQPTRPSWPPSPMMPSGSPAVPVTSVSAEPQPREPATASLDEPAAARRSPLAAARTALEVIQRLGTQAAQTLSRRVFRPTVAPTSAAADAGHVPFFASLPSLLALPRLRRAPEADDASQGPSGTLFFGVPSIVPVARQATGTGSRVPEPTRPGVSSPILLEQLVAQRYQPVTAGTRRQTAAPVSRISEGEYGDDAASWMSLPAAFSGLPLPLVSRARIAERTADNDRPILSRGASTAYAPSTASPTAPLGDRLPTTSGTAGAASPRPSSLVGISETVLTRTAALIGSLASRAVDTIAPTGQATGTSAFGTPLAAIRSFFGQFPLPRRRDALVSDAPEAAPGRPIAGMPLGMATAAPRRLGMPTGSLPFDPESSFFSTTLPFDLPLARRPAVERGVDSQDDAFSPATAQPVAIAARTVAPSQVTLHPVDFSAGVAARYIEPAAERLTEQPTATRPDVPSTTMGVLSASLQSSLSSLAAPLLRFLRLSDLRRGDADVIGSTRSAGFSPDVLQPTPARRPIFGGVPAPIQAIRIDSAAPAERLGTEQPRTLSATTAASPVFAQTTLSSLVAPLLRFLRLSDLRRDEAETARSVQPEASTGSSASPAQIHRPIFGGVPDPIQAIRIASTTPAEPLGAEQPRILPAAPGVPSVFAQTTLSSLAAPLLRFLRLSDLRRDEADATGSAQAEGFTGSIAPPSPPTKPIFGGVSAPMLSPAFAHRAFESGELDVPGQTSRRFATSFTILSLPRLPHRANDGGAEDSSVFGIRAVESGTAMPRPGSGAFTREDVSEAMPITVTAMQRFLSRWTQGAAVPGVSREQSGISRWFLPRRPAAAQEIGSVSTQDTGFGITGPSMAILLGRQGIQSSTPTRAAQGTTAFRAGSDFVPGPPALSETGEEDMTSAFQTRMLAPIREFLLSTLSRILSPLEALGQTPESRQAQPEEMVRQFRSDLIPDLLWWSPPAEDSTGSTQQTGPGWAVPSFPALGLPAVGLHTSRTVSASDGLGTERRRVMYPEQQTGFARSGLMALRLAAEHLSRSFTGQTNRRTSSVPDGPAERGVMPSAFGQVGAQRLPFIALPGAKLPATSSMGGASSGLEQSTESEKMDTTDLRSLRMPLPSTDSLLSPTLRQREAVEEGAIRVADRLNIPSLASLPMRSAGPSPMDSERGPAWAGGRTGRTLAGRVPAMPLPMRSERSDTAAAQDPYVIQRATTGTAVASPAPQSLSTASPAQSEVGQDGGGQQDVHGMATQVWTVLRAKLAREASRAGNG
jgi:hypothetical protein